jgi:hypothetical protein
VLSRVPLLIGLGPVRTGSSWTYELLFGHSQVATTRAKEVNYFNDNYHRGPEWYGRCFKSATAETKLRADLSPHYMFAPDIAKRIRETVPEPFFTCGLRSPYARIRSYFRAFAPVIRYQGAGNNPPTCSNTELFALRRDVLLQLGLMAGTLKSCMDEFGHDRFVFRDFAQLRDSPRDVARAFQLSLGLNVEFPLSVTRDVRRSVAHGPVTTHPLKSAIGRAARRYCPGLVYRAKHSRIAPLIWGKPTEHSFTIEEAAVLYRLLEPEFERDISKLEELLGRDLSEWRIEPQIANLEKWRISRIPQLDLGAESQPAKPTQVHPHDINWSGCF